MTTAYQEHTFTRGDPFKPGVLTLEAKDADNLTVDVPVAAFENLVCHVRKLQEPPDPDDLADVVGSVSLTPGPDGAITVVTANQVQILIHGSVTKTWTTQTEYFYSVRGTLVADGEPHTVVKGRILLGWPA